MPLLTLISESGIGEKRPEQIMEIIQRNIAEADSNVQKSSINGIWKMFLKTKRILLPTVMALVFCLSFASCDNSHSTAETSAGTTAASWAYYPDEQPVGYYKRYGISEDGETFDKMLELRDIADKGYLVLKEDWTAYFELDGEITEYTYDRKNLYLKEDTEKNNGFSYVHINGRLVVNYGKTTEQYMVLTDDELADYSEHGSGTDVDGEK